MNPLDWLRETKSWLWLAAVVALIVLSVFALGRCSQDDRIDDARNAQDQAEARTESAVEAIEQIDALNQRGAVDYKEAEEAKNAIRQADPADRRRVGDYQLCRLQQRTDCEDGL